MRRGKKKVFEPGQVMRLGIVNTPVAARRHNQLDHGEDLFLMSKCVTEATKYLWQIQPSHHESFMNNLTLANLYFPLPGQV
jgi:hypothetical protein